MEQGRKLEQRSIGNQCFMGLAAGSERKEGTVSAATLDLLGYEGNQLCLR